MIGSMMRRALIGDGSTLSLDFTTGVLDSRFTFTRSTTGTYIGSDGLVKTMAAAPTNDPTKARFDHDPVTLAPRGLLIEGSASNIALYSENINPNAAPWNVYWFVAGAGASVTPVSQADPAGGTTASRCILGISGSGRVYNGISTTAGVTYTLSFWARSVSGTTSLALWHFNSATGNSTPVTIGTSWQRYQVTILGRTGGGFVEFGIANLTVNAATVDFWGLQVETGSGASSYIPTTSSTANRAADFAVLSDLSAIGFNTARGSMVLRGYQTKLSSGSYAALAAFLDSADVDVFGIRNDVAGTVMFGRFAGTSTSAEATRTITNNAAYAFGMSADPAITTGAITVSMNGSSTTGNKSGSATAITTPTKFAITRPGYGSHINCGTIRSIKYWPTVKTAAELNSLTT